MRKVRLTVGTFLRCSLTFTLGKSVGLKKVEVVELNESTAED
jgi:hypothetical protein